MKAIICDIDSTISAPGDRLNHIKNGNRNWNAFFDGIPNDEPIPHTIELCNAMHTAGVAVICLTGRPEKYRETTTAWLDKHMPIYHSLYMRDDNDYQPGPKAKLAKIKEIEALGFELLFALDDHDGIVKEFRAYGLPTFHVTDDENDIPEKIWNGETFLTILVGPTGAGKSTFTEQFPGSWIVSSDEIREQVTPWRRNADPEGTWAKITPQMHANTWRTFHDIVRARLNGGLPTIADATNIKAKDRKALLDIVPKGQRVRYVIIDRTLSEKLDTADWRNEALIRRMHESFQSGIKYVLNGDGCQIVDVVDIRSKDRTDRSIYAQFLKIAY
jgi:predicted kinase